MEEHVSKDVLGQNFKEWLAENNYDRSDADFNRNVKEYLRAQKSQFVHAPKRGYSPFQRRSRSSGPKQKRGDSPRRSPPPKPKRKGSASHASDQGNAKNILEEMDATRAKWKEVMGKDDGVYDHELLPTVEKLSRRITKMKVALAALFYDTTEYVNEEKTPEKIYKWGMIELGIKPAPPLREYTEESVIAAFATYPTKELSKILRQTFTTNESSSDHSSSSRHSGE